MFVHLLGDVRTANRGIGIAIVKAACWMCICPSWGGMCQLRGGHDASRFSCRQKSRTNICIAKTTTRRLYKRRGFVRKMQRLNHIQSCLFWRILQVKALVFLLSISYSCAYVFVISYLTKSNPRQISCLQPSGTKFCTCIERVSQNRGDFVSSHRGAIVQASFARQPHQVVICFYATKEGSGCTCWVSSLLVHRISLHDLNDTKLAALE